ncbi:MAG: HAD family hydrolase [Polyangiaceae bacterium]
MSPPRLLAIDLDGTLVRRDGSIAREDRVALAALQQHGVAIVVATGRLYAGARSVLDELGLAGVQICADGAQLCDYPNGPIQSHSLRPTAAALREILAPSGLSTLVLADDRVLLDGRSAGLRRFAANISPIIEEIDDVRAASLWEREPGPVAVVTLGAVVDIDEAERALATQPLEVLRYDLPADTGMSSLTVRAGGVSKASGLRAAAEARGLTLAETAAVGDWLNDISMLEAARVSFAMQHAPDIVKHAADVTLEASRRSGGAIAEIAACLFEITGLVT